MVFYQALGEAYALTKHLGKDTGWMIDLFADSSGGPNVLKNRGPIIAKALSGEDLGAPAFDVDSIRKDLRTMLAEGTAKGFDLPLVARTLAVFDEAAQNGWGSRDGSSLPGYWTQRMA
jgi:3-hydroxyisobutyrate dehydrogenase